MQSIFFTEVPTSNKMAHSIDLQFSKKKHSCNASNRSKRYLFTSALVAMSSLLPEELDAKGDKSPPSLPPSFPLSSLSNVRPVVFRPPPTTCQIGVLPLAPILPLLASLDELLLTNALLEVAPTDMAKVLSRATAETALELLSRPINGGFIRTARVGAGADPTPEPPMLLIALMAISLAKEGRDN
jgi:hypothetical protein